MIEREMELIRCCGTTDIVTKPIEESELLRTIEQLLGEESRV